MSDRIKNGLLRHTIRDCATWACNYRVMGNPIPGKWTFKYHPWLREMHNSKAEMNIGQKSAQAGFSETLLNIAFYNMDINRQSVLYVLPSEKPDAHDFSASRFKPALELSPYLASFFNETDNVGHKRAGSVNLFIRGSKSRSGLKSIPTGIILMDELDEMAEEAIKLAMERASGQFDKMFWMMSTPGSMSTGINYYYKTSTQEHFFFKCPACSRHTELVYPDCLIVPTDNPNSPEIYDTHLICKECKNTLNHKQKWEYLASGLWVPSAPGRLSRGFHVNQMYSSTIEPWVLGQYHLEAQTNEVAAVEFHNSKLGLPFETPDASVKIGDFERCRKDYTVPSAPSTQLITMGIDVGPQRFHYVMLSWTAPQYFRTKDFNQESLPLLMNYGVVTTWEKLEEIVYMNKVKSVVVDANPERRAAFKFCLNLKVPAKMCYYVEGISGKQLHSKKVVDEDAFPDEPSVCVDRTSWLDQALGRIRSGAIDLPLNLTTEFTNHIMSLVREPKLNRFGHRVFRYETRTNQHDHFAHALNYAEIALPFALGHSLSFDMTS